MEIQTFALGPAATNAILAFDRSLGAAVLFDAPLGSYGEVTAFCSENALTLEKVWMTHGHWDHMLDLYLFNDAGFEVSGHVDDQVLFEEPGRMASFAIPGLKFEPGKIDLWIEGGDRLSAIGHDWELRHVPGHCPGSLVFWCEAEAVAIVGDAIFAGSVGRTDLPGGDMNLLLSKIREEIFTLPGDTVLIPGHGPETRVDHETQTNPFLR